jgi:hypothetical protein
MPLVQQLNATPSSTDRRCRVTYTKLGIYIF